MSCQCLFTLPVSSRMFAYNYDSVDWTCFARKMLRRQAHLLAYTSCLTVPSGLKVSPDIPTNDTERPDDQRCHKHVFALD